MIKNPLFVKILKTDRGFLFLYIYLRKVSTYKGYPCHHAHLTKTIFKSKEWGLLTV